LHPLEQPVSIGTGYKSLFLGSGVGESGGVVTLSLWNVIHNRKLSFFDEGVYAFPVVGGFCLVEQRVDIQASFGEEGTDFIGLGFQIELAYDHRRIAVVVRSSLPRK
jgi:hypothetical protein